MRKLFLGKMKGPSSSKRDTCCRY